MCILSFVNDKFVAISVEIYNYHNINNYVLMTIITRLFKKLHKKQHFRGKYKFVLVVTKVMFHVFQFHGGG